MDTREYKGNLIRVMYPSFLKVKTEEPQWSAFASKQKAAAMIVLNPKPTAAEAFARMIRNQNFAKTPGAAIEHEGGITTSNGLTGYERITRMTKTMGWFVDGKVQDKHILNIQIWSVKSEWYDGTIWRDFINSIEIL